MGIVSIQVSKKQLRLNEPRKKRAINKKLLSEQKFAPSLVCSEKKGSTKLSRKLTKNSILPKINSKKPSPHPNHLLS